ncbi:MAG TPA: Ni/Fe hydrogenase [Gammaproteobacteria bacterium]|nr:Ni/Fe hydrogenase [Gammaproteobacteria bacterium]
MATRKPILVFGYGNPSRGDDALGPALIDLLTEQIQPGMPLEHHVELLTDFQLQIEHAMDLVDRKQVIFVDASVTSTEPFGYSAIKAGKDTSYTTHAMSPAAVLHVYEKLNGKPVPRCDLLSIRGRSFELGQPVSTAAQANLHAAYRFTLENLINDIS